MSTGGHSFHMKDWMKVGGAVAAAAVPFAAPALAGASGLGGLLGGTANSAAAGGLAGLFGPSAGTAALAGDAFMPAALGASGTGAAPAMSGIGAKLAGMGSGNGLLKMGVGMMKDSMGAQQAPQAPAPFRPQGDQQEPSAAQSLSGVFSPQQSMANLTPEQRQMLMAMMGH